jgi:hypothetical protein
MIDSTLSICFMPLGSIESYLGETAKALVFSKALEDPF